MHTIKDDVGNRITSTNHGLFSTIRLKLSAENFHREIGQVIFDKREFHVKRQRSRHLMWRTREYGFNFYILDNAKMFDFVVVQDEHQTWRVPREVMLEEGRFMHFNNSGGFELQIFVKLATMDRYEVTPVGQVVSSI